MKLKKKEENYNLETESEDLLDSRDTYKESDQLQSLAGSTAVDSIVNRMSIHWGEEESELRMAVFVQFVKDQADVNFRKKVKKIHKEIVHRSIETEIRKSQMTQ